MAKKSVVLDLETFAKELGTRVKKSKTLDVGGYVRYKLPTVRGEIYYEGSGGVTLKVPGLDCFISHGDIWSQIKEMEASIAAYKALEVDVKKLKKALAKSERKIPNKPPKHGETNVSNTRKKAR